MDYYKKYLKYKSKYYKFKGGSKPIKDVRSKIKIELSGGNIYAMSAAHFYRLLLNLESSSQKNETYQKIYTYLQDTLLRKVNLLKSKTGINQRTVQMCIDRIQTILSSRNRNRELKKMIYFVANKVSDLDTKIIIQIDSEQYIIQGLQAFGLARIKRFDGELVDLSIPVQNTILGSIVSSSKSKEHRIIEELEIIIFFQNEDGKTDKRINRYIIQNIYFNFGLHTMPDTGNIEDIESITESVSESIERTGVIHSPTGVINTSTSTTSWYNVKARLDHIKAKSMENAQSANEDIDGNVSRIAEDEAEEEVFSQSQNPNVELEDDEDEDSGYVENSLPLLLCRDSLILRRDLIVTELRDMYQERQRLRNFDESLRRARIPQKYGGLEIFYQIYNPDVHDDILIEAGLRDAIAALTNKKKEVSLKTELHACILGLINTSEGQDPYITLRDNISVIITNMNQILQEELLFIDDPEELKSYFHEIESIQEIATICATVLEKMSFNPLLTMWTTEIYNFYGQNLLAEMNTEAEKNTMFISLKHERSGTAIVQWDSKVLKQQWQRHSEQNIWLKAHKFLSNNIYNDTAVVSSSSQSLASGPLLQSLVQSSVNASVAPIVLRNQIILFSVDEHYEDESNESNEFTVGEGQFIYVINNNITDIRLHIRGQEVTLNKEQLLDAQGYIIVSSSEKQSEFPFNQIYKFFRADIELPEEYDYQVSSSLAEGKLLKFLKPREKIQHHINLPQDSKIQLLPQSSMPVAMTTPAITYNPSVSQPIPQLSQTRVILTNHTILFSNEEFYEENSNPFTIRNEQIRVVNKTGNIDVRNNDGVSLNKDELHQKEGQIKANVSHKQNQDPFDKVYKFFNADIKLTEQYKYLVSNSLAEGKLLKFFINLEDEQFLTLPIGTEIYIKELSSSYDSHQYAEPSMNTGLNRSVFSMASQPTHNPMYAQPIYQQCQSVEQKKKYNYLNNRIIMFRNSVQHSFPLQISNSEGKEIYILLPYLVRLRALIVFTLTDWKFLG